MTDKFDTKGWQFDYNQLWNSEATSGWNDDKLYESADEKFACIFYKIDEYRMLSYSAIIAILENKNNPILLANPKEQWFDFQGDRSAIFSDHLLFLRKLAYNQDENLSGTPFVILNLDDRTFGFLDFDVTSIYYSIEKIDEHRFRLNLDYPNELNNMRVKLPNRHGQVFDITTIKFYSFDKINLLLDIYFGDKKINAC